LPKNTIAVEPSGGWHGVCTNQSIKAFQWLAWKEHLLCLNTHSSSSTPEPTANRIFHAGNGGEKRVSTPTQTFSIDVYNDRNKSKPTVYELHGCVWHGRPRCFPDRQLFSKFHPDRKFGEA